MTQVAEALMPILCSMPSAADAVARAGRQPSALGGQELGHEEQADALVPAGASGSLRQHQVDDVLGQVVLAGAR